MNTVLFTIDDVSSRNTPAIVDGLCERGIPAIMFAVGMNVERCWDEAVYAVRKGMIVGNHSYSHTQKCLQKICSDSGDAGIENFGSALFVKLAARGF